MIFLAEKNFEIVYKENGKNKKLLNNYNWKIFNNFNNSVIQHSMIFNKSLEFYKIGVTTNCGVKWLDSTYLYEFDEKHVEPSITCGSDEINIVINQFCNHCLFFYNWTISLETEEEFKKSLCFKSVLPFFFNCFE